MKTYEITATLHDGRVRYKNEIEATSALVAIQKFGKLHPDVCYLFQTLNVTEIRTT